VAEMHDGNRVPARSPAVIQALCFSEDASLRNMERELTLFTNRQHVNTAVVLVKSSSRLARLTEHI
jgi:hypothetical protein